MSVENQDQPPINKMGLDELRIKVAELCGWKRIEMPYKSDHPFPVMMKDGVASRTIPDFPADLNACAEFEKKLTEKQYAIYFEALCIVLNIPEGTLSDLNDKQMFTIVCATAEQRCRAFIATMEDKT